MTRARKSATTSANGISSLPGMPLAAFNPWNYLAIMAPSTASLAAFKGAETMLKAWRANSDIIREALRARQDSFLAMLEAPPAREPEAALEALPENTAAQSEPADFVTPMLDVTRAYSRVGKAFIVAQRDTMRAFTQAGKPH